MGRSITITILLIAIIFAAGCKGGVRTETYVVDDHHYDDHHDSVSDSDNYPWLIDFNVVDSFGFDTAHNPIVTAEIDPYQDNGIFDVYWDVDAVRDYIVEYRINDIPDVDGSRLIDAELCGWGLPCDLEGYQFCQYNPDFTLSCDVANPAYTDVNSSFYPLDISDMIYDIPQELYLVMMICDTESSYCEFDSKPVLLF